MEYSTQVKEVNIIPFMTIDLELYGTRNHYPETEIILSAGEIYIVRFLNDT